MTPAAASIRVPEWLRQRAGLSPDRIAVVAGDESLTFAALDVAVDAVAARLAALGVGAGDRVALLAGNGLAFIEALLGLGRLGAIVLPLNLRLTTAELAWQVEDAAAPFLIVDAARRGLAEAVRAAGPGLRTVALAELTAPGVGPTSAAGGDGRIDLDAVLGVIYTSGTTGRPKGVQLTYGNLLWSAVGSALNLGLEAHDRWLACLPLFHVGGLSIVVRGLIYGATVQVHETFDAAAVNAAIDDDGVTLLSVVSTMLQRLLDERGERDYPSSLRCVLVGGGPVPAALLAAAAARRMPVVQTYGLTEAASQVATLAPEEALARRGSAGKPLFGTEVRIVDDAGRECAPGAAGEIAVRGPTVTPGYVNRPDETARALRDGWLHTGDVGYVDAAGYLYVLDRRDDLIVSGGENVYPAEVEAALEAHPAVVEAAVFGRPDERWGQAVSALVGLRAGETLEREALLRFCRDRLAGFKLPTRLDFAAAPLPRTASGKLSRREIREGAASG